jgi:hypothetical protein
VPTLLLSLSPLSLKGGHRLPDVRAAYHPGSAVPALFQKSLRNLTAGKIRNRRPCPMLIAPAMEDVPSAGLPSGREGRYNKCDVRSVNREVG